MAPCSPIRSPWDCIQHNTSTHCPILWAAILLPLRNFLLNSIPTHNTAYGLIPPRLDCWLHWSIRSCTKGWHDYGNDLISERTGHTTGSVAGGEGINAGIVKGGMPNVVQLSLFDGKVLEQQWSRQPRVGNDSKQDWHEVAIRFERYVELVCLCSDLAKCVNTTSEKDKRRAQMLWQASKARQLLG